MIHTPVTSKYAVCSVLALAIAGLSQPAMAADAAVATAADQVSPPTTAVPANQVSPGAQVSPTDHAPSADQGSIAEQAAPVERGDIVVTARKKSEDILKTPVAITAFSSADLQARGIVTLNDLAAFTPGLKIVDTASGRADRSFQQIIIRGFTPAVATLPTTSIFIDGVPVSTATAVQNIEDPERVEVLKGPQSAYFGRQTFAGAVNVVTKDPTSEFSGTVDGSLGTHNNHDAQIAVSGPILKDDILGFRASYRDWAKDGSYKNAGDPSQTLGDQRTRSATLSLVFKPTSNFKAKAFGMYSTNNDGPSATGLISAYQVTNGAGQTILANQSNCTLTGRTSTGAAIANPYVCGTLPSLSTNQPSATTVLNPTVQNYLNSSVGRVIDPSDGVHDYGLRSRYYHLHLAMSWAIPDTGITLSSLTGYNNERKSELSDLSDVYDVSSPVTNPKAGSETYYDYPYLVEYVNRDFSQELRASLDKGPFRATAGVSYLNAFFQSGGGGSPAIPVSITSGATRSKTYGGFFGLAYDITSKLTINFDGRYQMDDLIAFAKPGGVTLTSSTFAPAGTYAAGSKLVEKKYYNFMPRAILNYQITPHTLAYASYSKGINPGLFTTVFLSQPAATQAAAAAAGFQIAVKPEKLDNYEVGLKGKLFDNKVRYALSAYYGIWSNQINQLNIIVPVNNIPTTLSGYANTGKVRMRGIEGEFAFFPTSRLSLNLSGAINDSYILKLTNYTVTSLTGVTNYRGKQNPLTSKYSAAASAEYDVPLPIYDGLAAFGRVDFTYKSGVFTDAANITRTPDMNQVDLHAGVRSKAITVEAYVSNLFNNKAYGSAIDYYAFSANLSHLAYNSGVAVSLRDLRTVGMHIRYAF